MFDISQIYLKVLFMTFLFYVNFGFWMLTRPTPISCVHDRNIFIDLTPPVSIKGLKPTGFNSNLPLSIQAHHFMFMPTSFNSSFGTHQLQFKPRNPLVSIQALKPTGLNFTLETHQFHTTQLFLCSCDINSLELLLSFLWMPRNSFANSLKFLTTFNDFQWLWKCLYMTLNG